MRFMAKCNLCKSIICIHIYDVSEWTTDRCLTPILQFVSYIMARASCMSMRWCLFYIRPKRIYNFLVLAQWYNRARLDISLNPYTLSWFRTNMSLPFSLNAVCLADKQPIQISLYKVWPDRGSNPVIYCTRDKHENHYTTDAVLEFWFS